MRTFAIFFCAALVACSSGGSDEQPFFPTPNPGPGGDVGLAALSDEFDDSESVSDWRRVHLVEQWGFDQLEEFDVDQTRDGHLTMTPYSSSWFEDYRGVLAFKEVSGDFVVTARVETSNRAGDGAPGQLYSLAGIMVRAPRDVTPETWTAGGENYIFLSLGAASNPGTFQTEVKTTTDSVSVLEIDPAPSGLATIRVARLGDHVIALIRPDGEAWRVHRRYLRTDLPDDMQVGLTTYTDWNSCSSLTPVEHNNALITDGNPDLVAQFDYVRYAEPQVPAELEGRAFSDPGAVSDEELLTFLGS